MSNAVEVVQSLLSAMGRGDHEAIAMAYAEDVRFFSGGDHAFSGATVSRAELFEKLSKIGARSQGTAKMDLEQVWPVGDELVVLHLRRGVVIGGDEVEADVVMALRVEDGRITEGVDVSSRSLIDFWHRNP